MLFLLVSVILFGLMLCGSGCLFGKLLGLSLPRNPLIYFWLGFFIISTLSMLCSLFIPIDKISLIIFFIIGTGGLILLFRQCKQLTVKHDRVEKYLYGSISFLILLAIVCMGAHFKWPGYAYDTDLYHAQTIRWYNEYSTPPGLGNLHARLAFNSSWLSLASLLDNWIWNDRSAWIMPALALLGGILFFLYELVFSRKNGIRLFSLCILAWLILKLLSGEANPSLYYDFPVHVLNAVIVLEAFCLFSGYTGNLSKHEIKDAASLLALSVSAFMIKPIGAVSLLFSGVLTLFLLIRNTNQTVSSWLKIYIPALCAFAIWVVKNIFLSGYLMFPLPMLAMPFDWTMTFAHADSNYKDVLAWARMPGPGYRESLENGFLFWFIPWLSRNLRSGKFISLIILPSCISLLIWFFVFRYEKIKKKAYFFIWTFLSIVYWFLTAPDMRFGDGFFWVFLGTAFLFFSFDNFQLRLGGLLKNSKIRFSFFYFYIICIFFLIGRTAFSSERNLFTIGTIPSRPVKEYTVNAAHPFTVWIPDGNDDRTGNSVLPSAPGGPSNLEMREPDNLGKGFRRIKH